MKWAARPTHQCSDPLQHHVPVHVLQAVVPEEHPVLPRDLLHTLHHKLRELQKISTELEFKFRTYFFPTGRCRGLMSAALKAAKKSSMGLAEKECGPVKSRGTPSSSKMQRAAPQV
jgi:hypothetical protein